MDILSSDSEADEIILAIYPTAKLVAKPVRFHQSQET